jgi:hypothetical protein
MLSTYAVSQSWFLQKMWPYVAIQGQPVRHATSLLCMTAHWAVATRQESLQAQQAPRPRCSCPPLLLCSPARGLRMGAVPTQPALLTLQARCRGTWSRCTSRPWAAGRRSWCWPPGSCWPRRLAWAPPCGSATGPASRTCQVRQPCKKHQDQSPMPHSSLVGRCHRDSLISLVVLTSNNWWQHCKPCCHFFDDHG